MEKMSKKEKILVGISVATSLFGIGCIGYSIHKTHVFEHMLKNSISKVEGMTEVSISDSIVNRAVENVVEAETKKVCVKAVDRISESISDDVARRVKGAVEQNLGRIQKSVGEQVAKEVAKINKDEIMNEVIERAKESATKQFEAKLDSILENQNQNLESIGRIYQGIADKMSGTKSEGKGIELKLS